MKINSEQLNYIKKNLNKKKRKEIAKGIGISESSLKRIAFENGLKFTFYNNKILYSKALKAKIISYYKSHSRKETQSKFKNIKVRSIVERYNSEAKQTKWSKREIVKAVQMAGLVDMNNQTKILNRKGAFKGSIVSFWGKKNISQSLIHGLPYHKAKRIGNLNKGYVKHGFRSNIYTKTFLWSELEENHLNEFPKELVPGIKALALFQRWIFNCDDNLKTKNKIIRMIKSSG